LVNPLFGFLSLVAALPMWANPHQQCLHKALKELNIVYIKQKKIKNKIVYHDFSRWLVVVVPCIVALSGFPMKSEIFWQFLSLQQPFVVFSGAVQSFPTYLWHLMVFFEFFVDLCGVFEVFQAIAVVSDRLVVFQ
jgi:sterol desaturase/sphingolipid hydroxylase (fatty acid hydroxylase superfamily)